MGKDSSAEQTEKLSKTALKNKRKREAKQKSKEQEVCMYVCVCVCERKEKKRVGSDICLLFPTGGYM